jgi:hypothetical protein
MGSVSPIARRSTLWRFLSGRVTCAKTFHLRVLVCIGVGDGGHRVSYGAAIRLARSMNVVLSHTTLHTPLNCLAAVAMPSLASCSPTHGSCWEEEYGVRDDVSPRGTGSNCDDERDRVRIRESSRPGDHRYELKSNLRAHSTFSWPFLR